LLILQKEMESLKTQVSELQLRKCEDEMLLQKKTEEIEKLKKTSGIESTTQLLFKDIPLSLNSNRIVSKRPFVRSNSIAASNPSAHYSTLGHSKSIWASFNEGPVDFGFFDVISQVFFLLNL
jgi:hypothetical protein